MIHVHVVQAKNTKNVVVDNHGFRDYDSENES